MTPSPTFRVENLGPIRRGEVELRPLTLFIGKNNTGKTYMAQAIHAAHKAIDEVAPVKPVPILDWDELDWVLTAAESQQDTPHDHSDIMIRSGEFPPALLSKVRRWMHDLLYSASDKLEGRILAYFSIPRLDDISSWQQESSFSLSVFENRNPTQIPLFGLPAITPRVLDDRIYIDDFDIERVQSALQHRIPPPPFDRTGSARSDRVNDNLSWPSRTLAAMLWYNYRHTANLPMSSHYLPAGRSGLLQAWTDVVRMKLQLDRERFGLERDERISLGGVALDFLSEFQSLFSPRRPYRHNQERRSASLQSAIQLLEQCIDGSVTVDSETYDLPALEYEQFGNRIPVQRASSMVADLAPLIIWTREIVIPGSLFVVDEPESHLHPEAIRLVARALVRLANAGVKVLCTTHSSVLLHQVSNCMLSATASNVNTGLSAEDAISHSDIGVFRFHRESDEGGVVITPVKIEPDWGIPEDEYVDVADQLINQAAGLSDSTSA